MKYANILIFICFISFSCISSANAAGRCVKGNCYDGYGTYLYDSGNEYTGTFKKGSRDGQGIFIFANGEKYIGEYKNGQRWGTGTYFFRDGMKYEGEYANDERNGFGIFTLPNGARYEGEYLDGMKHGSGKFIFPDGRAVNGTWKYGAFVDPSSVPVGSTGFLAPTYSLTINTFPENARIKFPEVDLKYTPNMKLSPGRYKVEVSHARYETKIEYIDILDADLIVPVTLKLAALPYLRPEKQKAAVDDQAAPEKEADKESAKDAASGTGVKQEIAAAGHSETVVDNPKMQRVRGVDFDGKDVKFNSLFDREEKNGADTELQEVDQRRINAAMSETANSQKLSMVEQVQQEVEMLKASFASPRLLSVQPLPGSNTAFDRVALVIGNSKYPLIGELRNPEHDAKDVADALRKLNFNVTVKINVDQQEMETAIIEFGESISKESVALFYYAGHGVQMEGNNYLIPVQSGIKRARDIRYKAVDLNILIDEMIAADNGKNIIILDACRNNPLPNEESRYQSVGLARTDAPAGTLIAYATSPGSVAIDGEGRNGIYTSYLLENIYLPGVPIEMVFKRVLQGVAADTNRKQIPWMSSSLDIDFYFAMK